MLAGATASGFSTDFGSLRLLSGRVMWSNRLTSDSEIEGDLIIDWRSRRLISRTTGYCVCAVAFSLPLTSAVGVVGASEAEACSECLCGVPETNRR